MTNLSLAPATVAHEGGVAVVAGVTELLRGRSTFWNDLASLSTECAAALEPQPFLNRSEVLWRCRPR